MTAMEKAGHLFEPEAVAEFGQEHALLASIAISMKRIADKMEGPKERRTRIRLGRYQWSDGFSSKSGEETLREAKELDDKRG